MSGSAKDAAPSQVLKATAAFMMGFLCRVGVRGTTATCGVDASGQACRHACTMSQFEIGAAAIRPRSGRTGGHVPAFVEQFAQ
jgi:hypothetical protein